MIELIFLLSFTLHNIEEGIWLPRWSKYAKKYHPEVSNREFHFVLIVITTLGYLITFLNLRFGLQYEIIKYVYLGFVIMMCFNSIFPHIVSTILLKRYAPGTLTALLLNLPIGVTIIFDYMGRGLVIQKLILVFFTVIALVLASLNPLFKLGRKIIDEY